MIASTRPLMPRPTVPPVPLRARLFGTGSIFGKTLRDSRSAIVLVTALLGLIVLAGGEVMATTYASPEARAELAAMSRDMPAAMRGIYGNPVNVDTLGGFVTWHYGSYFALFGGLWSILALSSTLAAEAARGSLDVTLVTPRSRRAVAVEKVMAHVVAVAVVAILAGLLAWVAGASFATIPRDAISGAAAASFAVGLAVRILVAGSVAFALAAVLGPAAAAGTAGVLLLGGYVLQGYRTLVVGFGPLADLTWWSWMAAHLPLAGTVDWGGVALAAAVALVLLVAGVEAFVRRDVGVTVAIPGPRLPGVLVGVGGPVARALGDLSRTVLWWAIGLGSYGLLMTFISRTMLDLLATSPALSQIFRSLVPGVDVTTSAGFLQLAFADIGFLLFGLLATVLVRSRWSDESSGRLEVLLASSLGRARWAASATVASFIAIGLVTAVAAAAIATGIVIIGQDPVPATSGTIVLGLYAAAVAGVGMAAGAMAGASTAMPVAATLAIGTFLLDIVAPILRLPGWVADLALTTHLGTPMTGTWDPLGVAVSIFLALGGLAVAAWSIGRRDV